jgi:hypothetical protein
MTRVRVITPAHDDAWWRAFVFLWATTSLWWGWGVHRTMFGPWGPE